MQTEPSTPDQDTEDITPLVNRVALSGIVTLDLEEMFTPYPRKEIDLKPWLFMEMLLKEKDFRQYLKEHNWQQYQGAAVAVFCSEEEALIPAWAYMLVMARLAGIAAFTWAGTPAHLENALLLDSIEKMDIGPLAGGRVVVKGCAEREIPPQAYLALTNRLVPVVKSLMYGEACSAVPVYKQAR